MIEVEKSLQVDRPPGEVFRYVADFSNMPEWDPGVVEADKLTEGPPGSGTCYRLLVAFGGRQVPMHYRVLCWEPDRRVVLEGRGDGVVARDDIRFSCAGDGTQISWRASLELETRVAERLLQPLFGFYGRRTMRHLADAFAPRPVPRAGLARRLADRLVLPGMLGFTRFGYAVEQRRWSPLTADMRGRVCVVTGATAGLGRAAAERLAAMGADLVLVGRDADKLGRVLSDIRRRTGSERLHGELADLSRMREVADLTARLRRLSAVHVLINNAGVLLPARSHTDEGFETSFATNLLGHVLLTDGLRERLCASAPARVINVSSGGMYTQRLRLDDLQCEAGSWDGSIAYARAKRAQLIYTEMLAAELRESGVVVNAMHPGWADTPGVETSLPLFHRLTTPILRSPEQGADTIVWLAAAAEAADVSGRFWLDRHPRPTHVLPGTRETAAERVQLMQTLRSMAAPYLEKL